MRILILNRFFGGQHTPTGRMAEDLAHEILRLGHDVVVVASTEKYTRSDESGAGNVRIIHTRSTAKLGRLFQWVEFWMQSVALLLSVPWDRCVILTDPPFMVFAGAASTLVLHGRKVYWWTMDLYPDAVVASDREFPLKRFVCEMLAAATNQAIRCLDGTIALGRRQRARLRAYANWPRDDANFCLVQPPWDLRAIKAEPAAITSMRTSFGWSEHKVALYAGNLGEAHTFDEILRAAARLNESGDSAWIFAFFCRGAKVSALRQRAANLPNVQIHDYLSDSESPVLLAAADVHLITMASGWEGIIVPSKLFGVAQTTSPIVFVGPHDADTADEIRRDALGIVLENNVAPERFVAALQGLPTSRAAMRNADGPRDVARFVTREAGTSAGG